MCKEIKKFCVWTLVPLWIGILLIGVGVGTSFIQFSSFTYGGTVLVNEDNIICEEFSFTIEEEGPVYIDNDNYLPYKVIGDETLEDNEIIFEINYDTNQYGIEVRNVSNEFYHSESEDLNDNQYLIEREYKNYSDFAYLLKAKDIVLEGIKNKKLYGIECEYWSDVVIRKAPENVDRIKDIR